MSGILTGTLVLADETPVASTLFEIEPMASPRSTTPGLMTGGIVTGITNDDGELGAYPLVGSGGEGLTLIAGTYRMRWRQRGIVHRGFFVMGAGATDLKDVWAEEASASPTDQNVFTDWDDLVASETFATLVLVNADENGDPGVWYRGGAEGEASEEGIRWLVRDDGVYFTRSIV